jgi:uncharacterized membrane protein
MTAGHGPWGSWDGTGWDGTGRPPGGHFRASDADRERVINVLKTAFTEGRLTKDEYDARVGQVFTGRTYADLVAVTDDLPVARPSVPPWPEPYTGYAGRPQAPRVNSLATLALILGLAQIVVGPVTAIPAIILGTGARWQIRQRGQAGYGRATAGVVLGLLGMAMLVVFIVTRGQVG